MRFVRRALEAVALVFVGLAVVCFATGKPTAAAGMLVFAAVPGILRYTLRELPEKGKLDELPKATLDALPEGERDAAATLYEKAQQDYLAIDQARRGMTDAAMAAELAELQPISVRIMDYMSAHPEKITLARKFVTYYQDRTAALAKEFVELEQTGVQTPQVEATKTKIRQTLAAMDEAYTTEFERLLSDKLLNVDAELTVMEQTLAADGIEDKGKTEPALEKEESDSGSTFVDGSELPKPDEVFQPQPKGPLTWTERLKRRAEKAAEQEKSRRDGTAAPWSGHPQMGRGQGFGHGRGRQSLMRRPDADLAIIPAPLVSDVRRQRILMSALAILLGTFGAHRFYQGRIGLGILYVLFCATGIPTLIGLVEGLRYATMSLEKFYENVYRPIG